MGFLRQTVVLLAFLSNVSAYSEADAWPDWAALAGLEGDYDIHTVWMERAGSGEQCFVHGCRLSPREGGAAFDLYFDPSFKPLGTSDLAILGIVEKEWTDQEFSSPGRIRPRHSKENLQQAMPLKPIDGGVSARFVLPPLNEKALLEEDRQRESAAGNSLVRCGVIRALGPSIAFHGGHYSLGALRRLDDGGWEWGLRIESPGAYGLRAHVASLSAPVGVAFYVYNPDCLEEIFGPYGNGAPFWTPTIGNDAIVLCCRGVGDRSLEATSFEIEQLVHVYRSPFDAAKEEGDCYLDVACLPEWQMAASAVGRLSFIDNALWSCTGALIAAPGYVQQNPPFLLTANHCINNQEQADSLEVWWGFQAAECGGAAPSPSSAARSTGGARFLVGANAGEGSDFSLLLLNQGPGTKAAYLGYTTRPIVVGEGATCLHHPEGGVKRLSSGVVSDTGSPSNDGQALAHPSRFIEVLWQSSSTAPGSSGSPLVLTDTAQIIGQLYGGLASCQDKNEPDYFGRFDKTFPLIRPWLLREQPVQEEEGEDEEPVPEQEGESDDEGEAPLSENDNDIPAGCFVGAAQKRAMPPTADWALLFLSLAAAPFGEVVLRRCVKLAKH